MGVPWGCRCDAEPILPEGLGIGETNPEVEAPLLDLEALKDPVRRKKIQEQLLAGITDAARL